MQLVTDKVTMYDTMKDRRIGIPEVIEKFGVPPEKVVEVQALAGDSTDNVPGVPGIGIKTAAQLIVEYGDLEQLLFRAGEIKQPKRREALIENAEKARISRQLVLLDDKVDLDVPLDDLAVHEPDARKLIAFLKAMEFSTLTRRVADYSQIDPSDVEADAGNKSARERHAPAHLRSARAAGRHHRRSLRGLAPPPPSRGPTSRTRPQAPRARRFRSPPRARKRRGRSRSIAANTRPSAASMQLKAWIARAYDAGHFAIDAQASTDRSDAGRHLRHRAGARAQRCLLRPARPQAIRRRRRACSTPASRRTRSRPATRWRR